MSRNQYESSNGRGGAPATNLQPEQPRVGDSQRALGDPERARSVVSSGSREGTDTVSSGGSNPNPGSKPVASLEGLFSGGFVAPPDDGEAAKRWPTVQLCMRATLTADGSPRAGGEVKTVAAGPSYVTTLTMPEEGRMLRVAHDGLSNAWDALEQALRSFPIPWVQCSDFARKRAKIKQKPEQKKLLDSSERGR